MLGIGKGAGISGAAYGWTADAVPQIPVHARRCDLDDNHTFRSKKKKTADARIASLFAAGTDVSLRLARARVSSLRRHVCVCCKRSRKLETLFCVQILPVIVFRASLCTPGIEGVSFGRLVVE